MQAILAQRKLGILQFFGKITGIPIEAPCEKAFDQQPIKPLVARVVEHMPGSLVDKQGQQGRLTLPLRLLLERQRAAYRDNRIILDPGQ